MKKNKLVKNLKEKNFVISGINLFEGGPLSIYYDFLDTLIDEKVKEKYHIVAFVHKKELFQKYLSYFEIIELPRSRSNYLCRLYYEYVYFYFYSSNRDIDVWISLHDITPRVKAKKIYTYCHNPSPFMRKDLSKIKYSVANVAFSFFYKYLYRINIKSATAIIVQQDWIRKEFLKMYPVSKVIVARPSKKCDYKYQPAEPDDKIIFLFVSYPRFFKNFEVICEAAKALQESCIHQVVEIWLTIDGTENKYSRDIKANYESIHSIKWIGIQPREKIFEMYNRANCLIFPSTLETWGLPISEFKVTGKPMLLADLSYAHETLGGYQKVIFFDPHNAEELKNSMCKVINDSIEYYMPQDELRIEEPYAASWEELIKMVLL